ncbi:amphiphysin isoform X2 [Contarinia nasturtii]|uniref:amphiphysin isoform X2 n=1 Tax=Contarinia nasturtii TaxID=265458 RepID=UPI0012D432BE|nr:amphiphysin isoform X2 [Contarinia nasturtii]
MQECIKPALKLLQNLGKVDRTADEIFDEHLTNFNRQQNNATRLQKEFNNYIRCIRAMQTASKSLMEAIADVYESQWTGADALNAQTQQMDSLWQDFSHKLGDQVLIPLNTYTAQFPEMKKKIEKRNRKLIDYDGQRHSFQSLQASSAKRKDDVKVTKGREQLDEARRTYEILNTELHDELPALYDSRILFLVTNLQTLFASEQVFHNETQKVYAELEAIVDKLATDSQRGSYTIKKITASGNNSPPQSPIKLNSATVNNSYPETNALTNGGGSSNGNSPTSSGSSPSSPKAQPQSLSSSGNESVLNAVDVDADGIDDKSLTNGKTDEDAIESYQNAEIIRTSHASNSDAEYENTMKITSESNGLNGSNSSVTTTDAANTATAAAAAVVVVDATTNNNNVAKCELVNGKSNEAAKSDDNLNAASKDQLYDVPVGATTTDLPPGVLYRVKATYKYVKEDVDELSFDVGETIQVIEYDDPEDQEEGWLMGQKEGTTEKGLFPANFTRPL